MDKHLNPLEKECMMQCMENLMSANIEFVNNSPLNTKDYKFLPNS